MICICRDKGGETNIMFGEFISDKLSELSKRTFFYVMRMIRVLFSSMIVSVKVISYYKFHLPKVVYNVSNLFGQLKIFYNNKSFTWFIIISWACFLASGTLYTGLPFHFFKRDKNQVICGGIMGMIHDVVLIIWTTFYGVFSFCLVFLLLSGGEVYIKGEILVVCAFIYIIGCILNARYKSNVRIYHRVIRETDDLARGNIEHTRIM